MKFTLGLFLASTLQISTSSSRKGTGGREGASESSVTSADDAALQRNT